MRNEPVDHSSSNWLVVPYQSYCITTTSGATITALGVDIRWKASDLLLYEPGSPGMAEQVSTTAVPTLTVISTANPSSPGMAEQTSTMAMPGPVSITAAPTNHYNHFADWTTCCPQTKPCSRNWHRSWRCNPSSDMFCESYSIPLPPKAKNIGHQAGSS